MGQLSLPFPEEPPKVAKKPAVPDKKISTSRKEVQKSLYRVIRPASEPIADDPRLTPEQVKWTNLLYLLYKEPLDMKEIIEQLEKANLTSRQYENGVNIRSAGKDMGKEELAQKFIEHMEVRLPIYRYIVRLLAEGKATTIVEARKMWAAARKLG